MMTSTDQESFTETLGKVADVTREALQSQFRIGTEFAQLAQNALQKGSDPVEAGRSYLNSAWREAGNYWQAVADLNIKYATELIKIGNQAVGLVVSEVSSAIGRSRSEGADAETETASAAPRTSRQKQS
jgi:hypothetical protein